MFKMAEDVHIIRISIFLFLLSSVGSESPQGLYSEEDDVVLLHSGNFNTSVVGKSNAWAIEFFSSWCGHCIRFAPTWKALATDLCDWGNVIKVGAVDCAQDRNTALCRHYKIEGYPTVKLFPHQTGEHEGNILNIDRDDIIQVRHAIIDYIDKLSLKDRPTNWPKLQPLKSIENIWEDVIPGSTQALIIFEGEASYIGREVMLDVCGHENVILRRMLKDSVVKFGIKNVPALYHIDHGGTYNSIIDKTNRTGFVSAIKEFIKIKDKESGKGSTQTTFKSAAIKLANPPDGVHMQDLESGLHYSLTQEIGGRHNIYGNTLHALKAYLHVLAKYFPGSDPVIGFLKKINGWLQEQEGPITGAEWLKAIRKAQSPSAFLPSSNKWVGCAGSEDRFRGYPCSLWTIFHTLTVNALLDSDQDTDFDDQEVLLAMRGYIHHFFGCVECRANFQKMATKIENEVASGPDAIMWLWAAHNKANKRLHKDPSEDPQHPKVQFPHESICRGCWKTQRGQKIYDEPQVLAFLKKFYGRDHIIWDSEPFIYQPKSAHSDEAAKAENISNDINKNSYKNGGVKTLGGLRRTKYTDEQKKLRLTFTSKVGYNKEKIEKMRRKEIETRYYGESGRRSWGFNMLDISLCVVFYLICTGIILLIYFHFTVTKRMTFPSFCPKTSGYSKVARS